MSTKTYSLNGFLLVAPIIVLLLTKFCIYYSITCFRSEISWIPSFIGYYIAICLMFFIASRYLGLPLKNIFRRSLKPVPTVGIFFLGIILPALLPLGVFILHIKQVPASYFGFIVLFSCINPIFEEGFWRGLLNYLPGNKVFRIFYSAFLFGFSHYFLWGYWFKTPMVIVPTVISTLIMGILWMWLLHKNKNIWYPVISHALVDIFNLSVAVYCGIITFGPV